MSLINIDKTIELDVYDHDTTPSAIKTIQMDTGTRAVYAVIQNSKQDYDIGQNASVSLIVLRPDKTKVQIAGEPYPAAETIVDGDTITYYGVRAELTQLALAVKGNIKAQFKITSGEQELRTEIFTISNGEALDADDGDWAGDLDGHNLDEMAESIETLQTDMAAVNEDVSDLKEGLSDLEVKGLSAEGATNGQTPVADGNGSWSWSSLYKEQLDEIGVYLGSVDSLNWAERMAYVREGKGRGLFPVGTQFYVPHGVLGPMLWDVVAHDHFINPANPSGHTMTLMTHYSYQDNHNNVCLNNVIYYASEGLEAGSYSFVVHGRATRTVDNGQRVYFTIVNDIPVGGQIRPLNLIYNTPMEGATAGVYANARSSEKLEEITFTLTPISGAIDLGTAGTGDLNNSGCVDDGIPDYDISDIRQWLNSDGDVGEWWSPQHKFCCTYYDGWAGAYGGTYTKDFILTKPAFLHDLDSTFLSYVCAVDYPTVSSAGFSVTHELREIYTVRDKFTLPASMEVGVSAPADNVNVGTCLEYFSNVDDTKRIKPRGPSLSANRGWWCRNASTSGDPNTLRGISTKGKIERRGLCGTGAFVYMCTLA